MVGKTITVFHIGCQCKATYFISSRILLSKVLQTNVQRLVKIKIWSILLIGWFIEDVYFHAMLQCYLGLRIYHDVETFRWIRCIDNSLMHESGSIA